MYNKILFCPHSSCNISHGHMIIFDLFNSFECAKGKKFTCRGEWAPLSRFFQTALKLL